jgi:hypothetical protein
MSRRDPTQVDESLQTPDMGREWRAFSTRLAHTLPSLGRDEYLIIDLPDDVGYVQFARPDGLDLRVETQSNHYRRGPDALSDAQIAELISLGWSGPTHDAAAESHGTGRPAGSSNFYRTWAAPVPFIDVASFVTRTLHGVLEVGGPTDLRYLAFSQGGEAVELPGLGVTSREGEVAHDEEAPPPAARPIERPRGMRGPDGAPRRPASPFLSQAHFDGRDALLPVHRIPLQIAGTPWSVYEDVLAPFNSLDRDLRHPFSINDAVSLSREALEALRVVEVIAAGDGTRLVFRAFDEAFGLIPARRGPFLELSAPALVDVDVDRPELSAALTTIGPMLPIGRIEPDHHGGVSLVAHVCADPFIALHLWHTVIMMAATLPPLRDALVAGQQAMETDRSREGSEPGRRASRHRPRRME